MKNLVKLFAIAFTAVTLVVACKSAPVMNIDSAPIEVSGKHTSNDVGKAIIRAGASLGWSIKSVGPGHMVGTLHLRKHVAVVDITFDKSTYSIKYKDSQGLNYDGTNIHSNYNGWITNLNRNIQVQLSTM